MFNWLKRFRSPIRCTRCQSFLPVYTDVCGECGEVSKLHPEIVRLISQKTRFRPWLEVTYTDTIVNGRAMWFPWGKLFFVAVGAFLLFNAIYLSVVMIIQSDHYSDFDRNVMPPVNVVLVLAMFAFLVLFVSMVQAEDPA